MKIIKREKCSLCGGHGFDEFPSSFDFPETPYADYRYLPCVRCKGLGYLLLTTNSQQGEHERSVG